MNKPRADNTGSSKEQKDDNEPIFKFLPLKSKINTLYTSKNNTVDTQSDTSRNEIDMMRRETTRTKSKAIGDCDIWHTAPDWYLTR